MRWKRMKISACEEFLTWCYLGLQQTSRCGNNICTVIVFIQTEWQNWVIGRNNILSPSNSLHSVMTDDCLWCNEERRAEVRWRLYGADKGIPRSSGRRMEQKVNPNQRLSRDSNWAVRLLDPPSRQLYISNMSSITWRLWVVLIRGKNDWFSGVWQLRLLSSGSGVFKYDNKMM